MILRMQTEDHMPRPTLTEPIDRWTVQARLNLNDAQWGALASHLTCFEGPGGFQVYDWQQVVSALRRVTKPADTHTTPPGYWSRRKAAA
jgi:hypothetical protein